MNQRRESCEPTTSPEADRLVEAHALTKDYGDVRALNDVTLHVKAGEVYGLVGSNGAGKTTLMRILTGLVAPTAGKFRVGNVERSANGARRLPNSAATSTATSSAAATTAPAVTTGSLIEAPAFYPSMSGRANLRLLSDYWGVERSAADHKLDLVGLSSKDRRRPYRQYSLGMKQRLGVAAALLGNPAVVVLDEPTNGLDPESIVGMRDIVRKLRAGGAAVLLSSHLLSEVEQVADRVGVLSEGRLIAEGHTEELRLRLRAGRWLELEVNEPARAEQVVRGLGILADGATGTRLRVQLDGTLEPHAVNAALVAAGIQVNHLAEARGSLEATFLELLAAPEQQTNTQRQKASAE